MHRSLYSPANLKALPPGHNCFYPCFETAQKTSPDMHALNTTVWRAASCGRAGMGRSSDGQVAQSIFEPGDRPPGCRAVSVSFHTLGITLKYCLIRHYASALRMKYQKVPRSSFTPEPAFCAPTAAARINFPL